MAHVEYLHGAVGPEFLRHVDRVPAVEIDPRPDFEIEECEQAIRAVYPVRLVVGDETRDRGVAEQAARRDRILGQEIAHERSELAL